MRVQLEIGFEQLILLAKSLPAVQWAKLKSEVDQAILSNNKSSAIEDFLLTAPTFSKKQLQEIEKARTAVNQWRKV